MYFCIFGESAVNNSHINYNMEGFMYIKEIKAMEILDSRGNPTVKTNLTLSDGSVHSASVPSGASCGVGEAYELRDKDYSRYGGRGVLAAVAAVDDLVAPILVGKSPDPVEADCLMIALDGCKNKSNLGANAILSVSVAVARAAAHVHGMPLYRYVGGFATGRLPIPMMNILNGGAHAANNIDVQEFMIVPHGARSFSDAVRMGAEVYHTLRTVLKERGYATGIGDEGGFAPDLSSDREALSLLVDAIERSGFRPGDDVSLALDVAASEWYKGGVYILPKSGERMTRDELSEYITSLVSDFPIISVEDGAADSDPYGWHILGESLSGTDTLLVGDDLFTTDPERIRWGRREGIANAVLVKPNQIGTLTECAEAIRQSTAAGYKYILSHRSGETEDALIADLAVGFSSHYIKTGAPARAERTAKYNRLMEIERELYCPEYGF